MAKAPILTPQAEDFPRWYQDVVAKAELADNGPVRGTMVIRPYGYAIWERMQAEIDARIKAAGAENAYFPLFIPESYLRREAEHVEGFSPELAVVTHAGGKELEEPVVVRPTSETVIGEYMAKWIQSYRDLPLLLNQWANVVRWELRPRLFLRTTEFLWQEGHTAHATEADAARLRPADPARRLRGLHGERAGHPRAASAARPPRERFAGAINTMTCEAMMGDGKALQMGTSHELGQNFAKAFDITYLDDRRRRSSWRGRRRGASSTRMVGGLIMAHGDDDGLRVPPALAPIQVVVLLVRDEDGAGERGRRLADELRARRRAGRASTTSVDTSFGRRATDWELKGVPVRIEVGPRDLAEGNVTHRPPRHRREAHRAARAVAAGVVPTLLDDDPGRPARRRPRERRDARTVDVGHGRRGRRGRPGPASPASRGRSVGDDGEDRLAPGRRHRPLPPAPRRRRARRRGRARPRRLRRPRLLSRASRSRPTGVAVGGLVHSPPLVRSSVVLERRGLRPTPLLMSGRDRPTRTRR